MRRRARSTAAGMSRQYPRGASAWRATHTVPLHAHHVVPDRFADRCRPTRGSPAGPPGRRPRRAIAMGAKGIPSPRTMPPRLTPPACPGRTLNDAGAVSMLQTLRTAAGPRTPGAGLSLVLPVPGDVRDCPREPRSRATRWPRSRTVVVRGDRTPVGRWPIWTSATTRPTAERGFEPSRNCTVARCTSARRADSQFSAPRRRGVVGCARAVRIGRTMPDRLPEGYGIGIDEIRGPDRSRSSPPWPTGPPSTPPAGHPGASRMRRRSMPSCGERGPDAGGPCSPRPTRRGCRSSIGRRWSAWPVGGRRRDPGFSLALAAHSSVQKAPSMSVR